MKHLGDITKLNGYEMEPVDCITGGSPCQDLSVAGQRAGLSGARSGLFLHQIRIVKEMREHERKQGKSGTAIRPRFMVWENVAGVFSSGTPKGADFAAVLTEIIRIVQAEAPAVPVPKDGWPRTGCIYDNMGRWSVAWRLHDAQFWGVPQRRSRVAVVADFAGLAAPEVLFERKGLSWDPEPGKATGQAAPSGAGGSFDPAGIDPASEVIPIHDKATRCQGGGPSRNHDGAGNGLGIGKPGDPCPTLATCDRHSVLAVNLSQDPIFSLDRTPCISSGSSDHGQAMCGVLCLNDQGGDAMAVSQDKTGTLRAQTHGHEPILLESNQNHATVQTNGVSTTLPASMGMGGGYVPMVCAGFKHKAASSSGSIGFQAEQAPTLIADQTSAVLEPRPPITAFSQNQRDEVRDLHDCAGALAAEPGVKQQTFVYENHGKDARYKGPVSVSQTVSAYFGTGGNNAPLAMREAVSIGNGQLNQITMEQQANTLDAMHDPQAVMVAHSLRARGNDPCREDAATYPISQGMVRRLTPLECERLQGFPDYWTQIGEVIGSENWTDEYGQEHTELLYEYTDSTGKKRKTSDSARYKALGNSIALPFWFYLLRRISALYERPATLGSLFDGIGGFPLCWERCNGKGTARWASEIEEFPMAVTRFHFGAE